MQLTLYGIGAPRTLYCYNPGNKSLGAMLREHRTAVELCRVNGTVPEAWSAYVPQAQDTVELWMRPGFGLEGIALAIVTAVITSVISFGISYGLGLLLANKPDPTRNQRPEETFGIAGLSNTIALGTPKFLVYGTRRVFGHLIGSHVWAGESGMEFSALYFMGEGEIANLRAVEINEIPIADMQAHYNWRPGTASQTLLTYWHRPAQVYYDARELVLQKSVVYQTKGSQINKVILILSVPYLQQIRSGTHNSFRDPGAMDFRIEYKLVSARQWTLKRFGSEAFYRMRGTAPRIVFDSVEVVLPSIDRWQLRVTLIDNSHNDQQPGGNLYNVEETDTLSTILTYPHSALLSIQGVASAQIQSFEGMKVSALVDGRKVRTWNGVTYITRFTRNRAWIIRDILTDPRVGMGHRVPPSLWDDTAALNAATYYMGEIGGQERDYCDIVINQRRPSWDWIRELLMEGNAALIPSQGKLKYVIDRPQAARLAYYAPGNVVEDSLTTSIGTTGETPNTVRGEFPDAAQNYRLSIVELQASDRGAELLKEQSMSLKSITRLPHALRSLAYALKKQRNVQRRYTWKSPLTGLISEPFDVVRLGYQTPAKRYGYSGYLQAGSTALHLLLDQLIPLKAGTTYEVIIRIQRSNAVYIRTFIAEATREQVSIALAPALAQLPEAGDLYAVGELARSMVTVLLDTVNLDAENDTYSLSGAEYRADIYDTSGTGLIPHTQKAFHNFPAMFAEDIPTRYHASYLTEAMAPQPQAAEVEPWPGAQLYRSRDPDDNDYELSYQGAPLPCYGMTQTALPAPGVGAQRTDLEREVEVQVTGGILTTITSPELQMNFNLLMIGQELLNFRIATPLGSGRYRLSHLRRGRRGTEYAVGTHSVGEPVLLVGSGIFTRDVVRSERNRQRNWKTPTIGQDVTEVPASPYAVPSSNLRPWTPGSARGVRASDGMWLLTWRGRARFLGAWVDGEESVPDYDVLYYELMIYHDSTRGEVVHSVQQGQGTDLQALQFYQYSPAQQQTDFGAIQATLFWDCFQIGIDDRSVPLNLVSNAGEGT